MGWLWGSSKGSSGQNELDPSLRDFLKKEAPTGPKPSLPAAPKADPPDDSTATNAQSQTPPEKPIVPPQSQFQDGRYAHLWKDYTPQHILDDRGKNEQDRLRDLVDAYNDRRGEIGRKAMENCAIEYMEQFECYRNPKTWWSAGTMCNAEARKFNRCYDIQSKFLTALGYMTMEERTKEEDERIQMHADKLYQRMIQQEAEMEKAKAEGRPVPKFESVISKETVVQATSEIASKAVSSRTSDQQLDYEAEVWRNVKPDVRKEYQKKIAEIPLEDREVERMAVLGELKASQGISKQVEEAFIAERISRMKRKQAGQATIGDTIKSWWGWG